MVCLSLHPCVVWSYRQPSLKCLTGLHWAKSVPVKYFCGQPPSCIWLLTLWNCKVQKSCSFCFWGDCRLSPEIRFVPPTRSFKTYSDYHITPLYSWMLHTFYHSLSLSPLPPEPLRLAVGSVYPHQASHQKHSKPQFARSPPAKSVAPLFDIGSY